MHCPYTTGYNRGVYTIRFDRRRSCPARCENENIKCIFLSLASSRVRRVSGMMDFLLHILVTLARTGVLNQENKDLPETC
jgi:hypothetical protein